MIPWEACLFGQLAGQEGYFLRDRSCSAFVKFSAFCQEAQRPMTDLEVCLEQKISDIIKAPFP